MKIKYFIVSRGTMIIKFENKSIKVQGELVFAPPTFYVMSNSFQFWESPYDNEKITEDEKREIIEFITKESLKEGQTKIVFD